MLYFVISSMKHVKFVDDCKSNANKDLNIQSNIYDKKYVKHDDNFNEMKPAIPLITRCTLGEPSNTGVPQGYRLKA